MTNRIQINDCKYSEHLYKFNWEKIVSKYWNFFSVLTWFQLKTNVGILILSHCRISSSTKILYQIIVKLFLHWRKYVTTNGYVRSKMANSPGTRNHKFQCSIFPKLLELNWNPHTHRVYDMVLKMERFIIEDSLGSFPADCLRKQWNRGQDKIYNCHQKQIRAICLEWL